MSTIASPRPSLSIRSPSASSRTSLDTSNTATRTPTNPRRNRAALRDYYGLKATSSTDAKPTSEADQQPLRLEEDFEEGSLSELDKEGFDAEAYVQDILSTQGLQGVLRVEASLVSQIRNLDSDRKSLVYDNYSKLISATDTIRKMRTNMDPLAPTTHTLSPAIAHIAETAASLSSNMHDRTAKPRQTLTVRVEESEEEKRRRKEREMVRWVLDTPRRLREAVQEEREEEAERDWEEVRRVLEKWRGVAGIVELTEECEGILREDDSSSE